MSTTGKLSDRSGGLVESHKGYDPRVVFFYFIIAGLLLVLIGGLAYQQLYVIDVHSGRERYQNQRRVVVPGPRGDIYARDGQTLLVGNRPRFSVMLYLDELKAELRREHIRIHDNFLRSQPKEIPTYSQLEQIARVSVVQRYLDQINKILGQDSKVDAKELRKHFEKQLLLPYPLINDLKPDEYAQLLERLPVRSAARVYTSSQRYYPFGSSAAQTLGYVGVDPDVEAEDLPGVEDLRTLKMKGGTMGKTGLEKSFDSVLQGEAGGAVVRVDPSRFRVDSPDLPHLAPKQGKNIVTSLDIDLQLAAEESLGEVSGAAVAIDVRTGEVLALVSKPDYNLNDTSPRISNDTWKGMLESGSLINQAIGGTYPPGSTFKILTTIAALRRGAINPDDPIVDCQGVIRIGNKDFVCFNRLGHHGEVLLKDAIAHSCDIYYYIAGRLTTPEGIAEEARRFHFDTRTEIELPNLGGLIPDPVWRERVRSQKWYPGDTANMAIGQGDVLVTPLQMACFAASVARGEVFTKPSLLHDPNRPTQRTEPIGLTTAQRAALLAGMEGVTTYGSAKNLTTVPAYRLPNGIHIAGKTGTAQKTVTKDGKTGTINFAWFICFAPVENPEIAMAVMLEGDTIGENYGGGANAAPIAATVMKKYFEKKNRPAAPALKVSAAP